MNQKPSGNGVSERPAAPTIVGVNNMVFLPNQQLMPQNGSNQETEAVQPRSIQPRLSLQFFEPESFLEVLTVTNK